MMFLYGSVILLFIIIISVHKVTAAVPAESFDNCCPRQHSLCVQALNDHFPITLIRIIAYLRKDKKYFHAFHNEQSMLI